MSWIHEESLNVNEVSYCTSVCLFIQASTQYYSVNPFLDIYTHSFSIFTNTYLEPNQYKQT